jgi:hypothetical protein
MTEELKPVEIIHQDSEVKPQKRASEVFGMFECVTTYPTKPPTNWFEQIKVFKDGATFQIIIYDTITGDWKGINIS